MLTGSAPDSWQHAYSVTDKERPIILGGNNAGNYRTASYSERVSDSEWLLR